MGSTVVEPYEVDSSSVKMYEVDRSSVKPYEMDGIGYSCMKRTVVVWSHMKWIVV